MVTQIHGEDFFVEKESTMFYIKCH
jgi:hypothetical protein